VNSSCAGRSQPRGIHCLRRGIAAVQASRVRPVKQGSPLASLAGIQTAAQGSTHIVSVEHTAVTSGAHASFATGNSSWSAPRTVVGIDLATAAAAVKRMHGAYRVLTLLSCVDQRAARCQARPDRRSSARHAACRAPHWRCRASPFARSLHRPACRPRAACPVTLRPSTNSMPCSRHRASRSNPLPSGRPRSAARNRRLRCRAR
jgi:hypothetical protein